MKIVAGMPSSLRRERHALRVVAGGCRHDAARALLGGQPRQPVVGTADLEGAGALQVLELQVAPGTPSRSERCCDCSSGRAA